MTIVVKQLESGVIGVEGPLTFGTAKEALMLTQNLIEPEQTWHIDLSKVQQCDSACLAFITAVIRHAKKVNSKVSYRAIPKQMRELGVVSGLEMIFDSADK